MMVDPKQIRSALIAGESKTSKIDDIHRLIKIGSFEIYNSIFLISELSRWSRKFLSGRIWVGRLELRVPRGPRVRNSLPNLIKNGSKQKNCASPFLLSWWSPFALIENNA